MKGIGRDRDLCVIDAFCGGASTRSTGSARPAAQSLARSAKAADPGATPPRHLVAAGVRDNLSSRNDHPLRCESATGHEVTRRHLEPVR
jgi:hypothetical protein